MTKPALVLVVLLAACGSSTAPADSQNPPPATGLVPITDLGTQTYLGFQGGLYPGGTNTIPTDHVQSGMQFARRIRPLDANGQPSAGGKYVLVSVGMSNTTQEFCAGNNTSCSSYSFVGQALADGAVDHTRLVLVDGAQGGQTIQDWDDPSDQTYQVVRTQRLAPRGLTEAQVQIVWIKQANPRPLVSLPASNADAYAIKAGLANILRALRSRYPNLQIVFLSSRIYGGYAQAGTLNPEPFAYESAFGVKWVIEEQIKQERGGAADPSMGDLRPGVAVPWIAWGPYLWANGTTPRNDGLVWLRDDFAGDATHPAESARRKVGTMLLNFLKASPHAACWFLAGQTC